MIAYALVVTAVLLCVATISNDNLQDLKTGQLVDATPWRQQVALVAGVVVGALVIPPILDLLNRAYGFAGAVGAHGAVAQPLPAPQATLISALAKGVISGQLDWHLIGTGAIVGALVVAIDETLRAQQAARVAAARRRFGHLSARLDDRSGRARCDTWLGLQPLGCAAARTATARKTARRTGRFRTHRRGEPLRRVPRRLDRF